jgi:hypothetical protein
LVPSIYLFGSVGKFERLTNCWKKYLLHQFFETNQSIAGYFGPAHSQNQVQLNYFLNPRTSSSKLRNLAKDRVPAMNRLRGHRQDDQAPP